MSRFVLEQLNKIKALVSKILPQRLSGYNYQVFFVFLLVVFFALSTKYVHAGFVEWIVEAISSMLLGLATVAMALTIFFLRYFITLASYNNYIDVSVVKLGWVMVRDVANMFFVVSLLVIAFATILGVEKYEWKKGLVKLVIMAILINFSNLIAQIIIDAAHIFTITFLNAVSASAGGNLMNMFSLGEITNIITGKNIGDSMQSATSSIFVASFVAFLFAVGTAVVMGSYVVVMALRVVVLWALIILSPLAYLMSALPNGEKYSQKWWTEFMQHVIVAPVMVFFLWLAFATLGTGQIMSEIKQGNTIPLQQSSDALSVSLTSVSTWENMSNYILALIFLMIGLKMTRESGATGAGMLNAVEGYAKKVATIASGYAAGRWLVGKGVEKGKKFAGDYGKLTSAAVMDTKAGKFVKKWSGAQWLGNAGIRREAAMERLEQYKKDKKKEIMEKGGGFSGWLAPSYEKMAAQEAKATAAAAEAKEDYAKLQIDAELDLASKEKETFDKRKEKLLDSVVTKRLAEAEKKAQEPNASEEDKKAFEDLKMKAMNARGLQDKSERLEELEKTAGLTDVEATNLDNKAMFGLIYMNAKTRAMENVTAQSTMRGVIDETFNKINLARLSRQRNEQETAVREAMGAHIDEKMKSVDDALLAAALDSAEDDRNKKIQMKVDKVLEEKKINKGDDGYDKAKKETTEKIESETEHLDFSQVIAKYLEKVEREKAVMIEALVKGSDEEGPVSLTKANKIADDRIQKLRQEEKGVAIKALMEKDGLSREDAEEKYKSNTQTKVKTYYDKYLDQETDKYREELEKEERGIARKKLEEKVVARERDLKKKFEDDAKGAFIETNSDEDKEKFIKSFVSEKMEQYKLKNPDKPITELAIDEELKRKSTAIDAKVNDKFADRRSAIEDGKISDTIKADTRAGLVDGLADYEKANVMEEVIKKNPQWTKMQSFYATKSAARSSNKYKGEEEKISARMSDILRGVEGKTMDEEKNWERSKISSSIQEFQGLTPDERMLEMKKNVKTIKELGKKERNGTISIQEADVLKNASQRQAGVMASISDQGEFNWFANEFRGYAEELGDSTFRAVDNSTDNTANLFLGALTGFTNEELKTDMSGAQETLRKRLKEKSGVLMRTVMKGLEGSVNKGNYHQYHQVVEGVDANGNQLVGFAKAMRSGVGTGSGRGMVLGTGTNQEGLEMAKSDARDSQLPGFNFSTTSDGRSFMDIDGYGRAVRFKHEQARQAALSVANMNAHSIHSAGTTKLRYMAGSDNFNTSLYNESAGAFQIREGEIKSTWRNVVELMVDKATSASPVDVKSGTEQLRELFSAWGLESASTMDATQLKSIAKKSGLA